jgi:hypothetical protein
MGKVPDEETMKERLFARKPDALATGLCVGKHGRVVHSEIDLGAYSVGHVPGRGFGLRDVIDKAIRWIGKLLAC